MARDTPSAPSTNPNDLAELLESYASEVIAMPGVSRRNPEAFTEAKSELYERIRRDARAFRAGSARPARPILVACESGPRLIGQQRKVLVEVRRRRSPAAR